VRVGVAVFMRVGVPEGIVEDIAVGDAVGVAVFVRVGVLAGVITTTWGVAVSSAVAPPSTGVDVGVGAHAESKRRIRAANWTCFMLVSSYDR
jgi:hypothetical protein